MEATAAASAAKTSASSDKTAPRGLHIGLWIAQALLGAAFLMAGGMKLFMPIEVLTAQMPWMQGAMGPLARFIGFAEVLGGLGVLLPAATRIQPRLTAIAALGLTVVMGLAVATHVSRGETFVPPLVLGALAAFVAWGRGLRAPIASR